jgi:hypothetical protein
MQTVDENVDEPQDARLPARLVMHVAHAQKSTKQVFGADVFADFALLRSLGPGRDVAGP